MPYTPLNPETRGKLLAALNAAGREVFPGLLAPIDAVARAFSLVGGDERLILDDLPPEVIADVAEFREAHEGLFEDSGSFESWCISQVLGRYVLGHNQDVTGSREPLNEIVWPALRSICHNIDAASLRMLWDTMVESRIQHRLTADVMLNLAEEFCENPWSFEKQPARFAEVAIYRSVWQWPSPMPPSLAYAATQTMTLAFETRTLPTDEVLNQALWLGRMELVRRVIHADRDEAARPFDPDPRITRFCNLARHIEGLIHFIGDHLDEYVDSIEEHERRYFQKAKGTPTVPTDSELQLLADGAAIVPDLQRTDEPAIPGWHEADSRFSNSVEMYISASGNAYEAIPQLTASLFYVDHDVFRSHQAQRVARQAERWLCYWFCNDHRYGEQQPNFDANRFAAQQVRLQVVRAWHEGVAPAQLLANARRILEQATCRRWTDALTSSNSTLEYLLPCWLLELRALRMHGRGTPEWDEADRLTAARLSRLFGLISILDFWSADPGWVLFVLESIRQVAVARTKLNEPGAWDAEILKCARQLLLRLEMIDCPNVRRTMSGFLQPILTAIGAWRTRTYSDAAEGLCLFEMARSRWMIDQLALGNRTLLVRPEDDEASRRLKDQLFEELNQEDMPTSASQWYAPSNVLVKTLRRDAPDLGRLVLSNWLKPDVLQSIPDDAAVLTFEMEYDPADPPKLCIAKAGEPWSVPTPGNDSQLWIFVVNHGNVRAELVNRSCSDVFAEARTLSSLFGQGLVQQDGPAYRWTPLEVGEYEKLLAKVAALLLHPVEDSIVDSATSSLLVVPSGELFEIPWAALPLNRKPSLRLIDAAAIGVLPNLGLAVWQTERPTSTDQQKSGKEILIQAVPNPPTGLRISNNVLAGFRSLDAHLSEGGAATPDRAIESLQRCEFVAILCHGRLDAGVFLELSPAGEEGRLTLNRLELMPAADGVRGVLLGACWTGLRVQHAAEGAEGLAGMLLLKGVTAVFAGNGCIPIPVDLIAKVTQTLVRQNQDTSLAERMATTLQRVQRRFRDDLTNQGGSIVHPWRWSSIAVHGVPWT